MPPNNLEIVKLEDLPGYPGYQPGNVVLEIRHREIVQNHSDWVDYDHALANITAWMHDNTCGRRVSYDMFVLNNEEAYTMFMLRWS